MAFDGRHGSPFAVRLGDYRVFLLLPALLGLLLFTRFLPRVGWLARWSLALIIGVYAGLKTTGFAQSDFVAQVHGSIQPLWTGQWGTSVSAVVFTVGLISSLLFFYFSREQKGVLGGAARARRLLPHGLLRRGLRLHGDVAHLAAHRPLPVPARSTGWDCADGRAKQPMILWCDGGHDPAENMRRDAALLVCRGAGRAAGPAGVPLRARRDHARARAGPGPGAGPRALPRRRRRLGGAPHRGPGHLPRPGVDLLAGRRAGRPRLGREPRAGLRGDLAAAGRGAGAPRRAGRGWRRGEARGGLEPRAAGGAAPPCFASTARHEIVLEGRKLVGSAQRRTARALLQQGSILLGPGHLRLADFLAVPARDAGARARGAGAAPRPTRGAGWAAGEPLERWAEALSGRAARGHAARPRRGRPGRSSPRRGRPRPPAVDPRPRGGRYSDVLAASRRPESSMTAGPKALWWGLAAALALCAAAVAGAQPLRTPMAETGVPGGRFVIGTISDARTFNPILSNETSSSDVSDRLFTALTETDNLTRRNRPGAGAELGGEPRRPDVDVAPAARRALLRRPPHHRAGRAVQLRGGLRFDPAPVDLRPAQPARAPHAGLGPGFLHRRDAPGAPARPARAVGGGPAHPAPARARAGVARGPLRLRLRGRHAAREPGDERAVEAQAVRAAREDGADAQPVLVRRGRARAAPAVPRRAGLPGGARTRTPARSSSRAASSTRSTT